MSLLWNPLLHPIRYLYVLISSHDGANNYYHLIIFSKCTKGSSNPSVSKAVSIDLNNTPADGGLNNYGLLTRSMPLSLPPPSPSHVQRNYFFSHLQSQQMTSTHGAFSECIKWTAYMSKFKNNSFINYLPLHTTSAATSSVGHMKHIWQYFSMGFRSHTILGHNICRTCEALMRVFLCGFLKSHHIRPLYIGHMQIRWRSNGNIVIYVLYMIPLGDDPTTGQKLHFDSVTNQFYRVRISMQHTVIKHHD